MNDAVELLDREGVTFQRCIRQCYTCGTNSLFTYFMNEDTDVAYYWSEAQTVIVHDTPRNWSELSVTDIEDVDYTDVNS